MRVALWFMGLFAVAAALALFASSNSGTITVFLPPHRLDLSLNMVVLLAGALFFLMHLALKAISALFAIPGQARSWRIRHQERAMHGAMLDALSHLVAGRYLRARKSAEVVLAREATMTRSGEIWSEAARLRVLAHLLAAESSQALQDKSMREVHFQQALAQASLLDASATREGVLLRAVRWSLEDRDAGAALDWFDQLPGGVARRTVALRLRLKVARMARKTDSALETARLLAKHRAFSEVSAQGLVRALALEYVQTAFDVDQLNSVWQKLEASECSLPEVACAAAGRLLRLGGAASLAFEWLLPIWDRMVTVPEGLSQDQKIVLIRVLENGFSGADDPVDTAWLSRIEQAQMANPGDATLQYLAGVACLHLQLWGKAQQLLKLALPRLVDSSLLSRAWQILAELAQRQGDDAQAAVAWKNAAQISLRQKV
jgi:HemY protein